MLALVIALVQAATTPAADQPRPQPPVSRSAADSARLVGKARGAIEFFLGQWRSEWLASEEDMTGQKRNGRDFFHTINFDSLYATDPTNLYLKAVNPDRLRALHCHLPGDINYTQGPLIFKLTSLKVAPITADSSARSMCATWILGPRAGFADASRVIDSSLTPARRDTIRQSRARLLAYLDNVLSILPGDELVTGQRVRFLLDQERMDDAQRAVDECKSSALSCLLLRGYVAAERGATLRADSLFTLADAMLSDSLRCTWDDVGQLLPRSERRDYKAMSCARKAEFNRRFWWVSDPMFAEPGNERRAVHFSRKVWLLLHRAFRVDERYNWEWALGGDAVTEMITRYGKPTFHAWGFSINDRNHTGYLIDHKSVASPPYTTAEYSFDRWRSVPVWSAIESPFTAPANAWTTHQPLDSSSGSWWPAEHFPRQRPLRQFDDGQYAAFRRQDAALFATAVDGGIPELSATIGRRSGVLYLSTSPDSIFAVDQQRPREDGAFVLQTLAASRSYLVSIESPAPTPRGDDVRTRFGVTLPPTLASMKPGDVAISDPVFLRSMADAEAAIGSADDAIANMRPTVVFDRERRIAFTWETYGLRPSDSVEVSVRVQRVEKTSAMERLGIKFGVVSDPNGAVEIRWREPQPGRTTRTLEGPVPVQLRTLQLDLARQQPGDYELSVAVARHGGTPVSSKRAFRLK